MTTPLERPDLLPASGDVASLPPHLDQAVKDPPLRNLLRLFPGAVFLPVPAGQLFPSFEEWPTVSLAQSHQPSYLNLLASSNIAVRCGPTRHLRHNVRLCALSFESLDAARWFTSVNPSLIDTFAIIRSGVDFLYLVEGYCPSNMGFDKGAWISGSLPFTLFDRTAAPNQHVKIQRMKPILLKFSQIDWRFNAELAFTFRLLSRAESYGQPLVFSSPRTSKLNASFFADMLIAEFGIRYDEGRDSFVYADSEGRDHVQPESELVRVLLKVFQTMSKLPGFNSLHLYHEIKDARNVLQAVKALAPIKATNLLDVMRRFLFNAVEASPSDNLTTQELEQAYVEYCQRENAPALPSTGFQSALGLMIKELYGASKTHSLERDGKPRRGFRGVRLR